jgi:hypothetical protein
MNYVLLSKLYINTQFCANIHVCRGPGWAKGDFASNEIIGERQYSKARELYESKKQTLLTGPVNFSHMYLNMANTPFTYDNGTAGNTCPPAMGHAFAAGTTDGRLSVMLVIVIDHNLRRSWSI